MKKRMALLVVIVAVLLLAACGDTKSVSLADLKNEIQSADLFADHMAPLSDDQISSYAMLDIGLIAIGSDSKLKCAFFTGSGLTGEEYGIFECLSVTDAKALVVQLINRQLVQQMLYAPYDPEIAARIGHGFVRSRGIYVFYIVADQYDEAAAIADRYF